jgi:hypothetical protein
MPIPQFLANFRLNPNSSTNKERDDEAILENRVISVLKALELKYNIQFTSPKGTNKDKWIGFQQMKKNLGSISKELKLDPRVAYLTYVGDTSKSLEKRLEARRPTQDELENSTPWKSPNEPSSANTSRPASPAGSEASNGSNAGSHERGGRRSRHKTRRGTGKRRHRTARRRHR